MIVEQFKTPDIHFDDLIPLKGSSCYGYLATYGLDTELLDGYSKAILLCRSLLSPVLIFRDLVGNPRIIHCIPDQDSPISDFKTPAYFYCREIGAPCLIKKVQFFKEPIELLSYLQLHYPISTDTLCLTLHPHSPINELSHLSSYFSNARFVSFIPNLDKADILLNLKLSLSLAGKEHQMNISDNTIHLNVEGKILTHNLNQIQKNIIPFVKRKQQQPLLFKRPPKKYASFNSMLNDKR